MFYCRNEYPLLVAEIVNMVGITGLRLLRTNMCPWIFKDNLEQNKLIFMTTSLCLEDHLSKT